MSKPAYPFRLCAPSFVYPGSWAENVKRLGESFHEIEILCFESAPSSLPGPAEVREMARLGKDLACGFHVHLPIDILPGSPDPETRTNALAAIERVAERCAPLDPTTFVLHLPMPSGAGASGKEDAWRSRLAEDFQRLSEAGLSPDRFSVETLDYPLSRLQPLIGSLGLGVCVDTGHILLRGGSPLEEIDRWAERLTLLHLHGASGGRDHLPLSAFPSDELPGLGRFLRRYTGKVCLEVFSPEALAESREALDRICPLSSPML